MSRLIPHAEFSDDVHFSCFGQQILFLDKLGPKNRNCLFKIKVGMKINSSVSNLIIMFTFSSLDKKHRFWKNLVQKLEIVCLR